MKHKKARIALAFSLIMLMLGMMLFPHVSKAYLDTETWLSNYAGHMEDGTARGLIVTRNDEGEVFPYLKIGDSVGDGFLIYNNNDNVIAAALDGYGMVNILCSNKTVIFWSYDLFPEETSARDYNFVPNAKDPKGYMNDIESFDFKGTGENAVITGYKSVSGEVYPLPSLDEMKEAAGSDSSLQPRYIPGDGTLNPEETPRVETPKPSPTEEPTPTSEPTEVPTQTPTQKPTEVPTQAPTMEPTSVPIPTEEPPEAPTMTPTTKPTSTEEPPEIPTTAPTTVPTSPTSPTQAPSVSSSPILTPSNTSVTNPPNVTVQPTVTPSGSKKLTVKTSKKKGITTYSLCEGDKTVIQYTLKKGKLTWKVGVGKKGTYKGIKYAGFIKKSRNLYYGDKKGRGYTISSKNGKRKLIIKKGAKKPIYLGKFITRVKIASKSVVDISNK